MNTLDHEQLNQLPKEMLVQMYLQMSSALDTFMEQNRKITEQNERQARQIEALQENLAVLVQNQCHGINSKSCYSGKAPGI